MIVDVSATELAVKMGGVNVVDFMDDENPVSVERVKTGDMEFSCNGNVVRNITPDFVVVKVCVIAGTKSDRLLRQLLENYSVNHVGNSSPETLNEPIDGSIQLSKTENRKLSISFSEGSIIDGEPYATITKDGRMSGVKYTFMFKSWKVS